jgi:septum formation topological specificity factor MinE
MQFQQLTGAFSLKIRPYNYTDVDKEKVTYICNFYRKKAKEIKHIVRTRIALLLAAHKRRDALDYFLRCMSSDILKIVGKMLIASENELEVWSG